MVNLRIARARSRHKDADFETSEQTQAAREKRGTFFGMLASCFTAGDARRHIFEVRCMCQENACSILFPHGSGNGR